MFEYLHVLDFSVLLFQPNEFNYTCNIHHGCHGNSLEFVLYIPAHISLPNLACSSLDLKDEERDNCTAVL